MGEHTPWRVIDGPLLDIHDVNGKHLFRSVRGDLAGVEYVEQKANASRIVAAVNFTAGYEIPADVTLGDFVEALGAFTSAMDMNLGHQHEVAMCEANDAARALLQQSHPTPDDSTDTGDAP